MEKAWLLLSQVLTLGTTWCMFRCILNEKEKNRTGQRREQWIVPVGVLTYLLLPAHVAVVREERNWAQIVIWMLVPMLTTALFQVSAVGKKLWRLSFALAAILVVGVIGRLDGVAGVTILFLICVAGVIRKRPEYPMIGVLGIIAAYPTYLTWKSWIFDGHFAESGYEYTSIMEKGYSIGGLFSTYFHRNGNPGMGILLTGGLALLVYYSYVRRRSIWTGTDLAWLGVAGLLTVMSLRYFPWDYIQRLGTWAVGLVSLIGTPAVFFAYAQIILCVLCIEKISDIVLAENSEDELEKAA